MSERIAGKHSDVSGNADGMTPDGSNPADLLALLREANENLVIATLEAQNMREQAEAINRRQNEFLAMLAHELRNPLAPISMAATLLEHVAHAHPDLPKLQGVIQRQVEHMSRLLEDLLDAARISTGRITLQKKPVLLSDIIGRAVETCLPNVQNRQQKLDVRQTDQPVIIEGDAVRLAQVFSNMLWNASKFTEDHGIITLTATAQDNHAVVSIEDNGAGIAPELLPHIFDMFTQGSRELARTEGGLGIGLAVVRSLVQMHGGSVEVHSAGPGVGSRFTVKLPCSAASVVDAAGAPDANVTSPGARVLLIEDNLDAGATLRDLLALNGHSVDYAADGTRGLEMAVANTYHLVLCDIGLPGIDGYEVVTRLREHYGARSPCTAAVTGYGQPEDRARAHAAGFDHFFVKPVDVPRLLETVARVGRAFAQST